MLHNGRPIIVDSTHLNSSVKRAGTIGKLFRCLFKQTDFFYSTKEKYRYLLSKEVTFLEDKTVGPRDYVKLIS